VKSRDILLLRRGYLDVLGMIAACGIPAGVGIAATSHWVVPVVLGDKWIAAIPLVAMLAVYGVLSVIRSNAHYVFLAQGKPYLATYLAIIQMLILIPSLTISSLNYGFTGAAYAYVLSEAVMASISFMFLFGELGVGVGQAASVLWRPLLAAAFMYAVVQLAAPPVPLIGSDNFALLAHLLTAVSSGAIAYVTFLYILWIISARPVGAESRALDGVSSVRLRLRLWFEAVSASYR
jgi:O-antigen/teichoic acid export membrane protein